MDGEVVAERGDLLGKLLARFLPQSLRPLRQHGPGSLEQRAHFVPGHLLREQGGRQLRAVKDLVRIRVADSREQARIGQRALQRVVLATQRGLEFVERAHERLDPAALELVERSGEMDRGALLRRRLREHQRAGWEIEGGKADLSRDLRSPLEPLEPAGDHQVNHQEQPTLEDEDDPLAEPANLEHAPSAGCAERRVEGAHHERTRDANTLQRLTGHARRDRLDVDGDVRKLRHAAVLTHLCSARSRSSTSSKRYPSGSSKSRETPPGISCELPRARAPWRSTSAAISSRFITRMPSTGPPRS